MVNRSIMPRRPLRRIVPSPVSDASRSSDILMRAANHAGTTSHRPVSGMFCSSSTCPIRTIKSVTST